MSISISFIIQIHLYYISYRRNRAKSKRDKNIPQCGGTLVNKVRFIKQEQFIYLEKT